MTFATDSPFSTDVFSSRDTIVVDGMAIPIARAEAFCPVCGAEGGTCTDEGYEPPEEIRVVGDWLAKPDDKTFRVPHDVYIKTPLSAKHVLTRRVATEGEMISPMFAQEIGLI